MNNIRMIDENDADAANCKARISFGLGKQVFNRAKRVQYGLDFS